MLRQLDMPANFFAGNNCVAESGQLPSNFLLGVSTRGMTSAFDARCGRGSACRPRWRVPAG